MAIPSNFNYLLHMRNLRYLTLFLLPVLLSACSEREPQNLEGAVAQHLEANEYEEALDLLRNSEVEDADIRELKIEAHLAYGYYLTHEADHLEMGDRMANALRHFRRVLELDAGNSQALTHVELIEGIYEQMGRDIPEGVAD